MDNNTFDPRHSPQYTPNQPMNPVSPNSFGTTQPGPVVSHDFNAPVQPTAFTPAPPVAINPTTPPPAWTPSVPSAEALPRQGIDPTPVVKVLSTRGVEYAIMTFALWFTADALVAAILVLIDSGGDFSNLALPAALLIVSLPIFGLLFIRLRKAELEKPSLKLEPSKRRWSQITQIFTFVVSLLTLVAIVYVLISKMGGNYSGSLSKTLFSLLVVLIVTGGIFWYYWTDEYKHVV